MMIIKVLTVLSIILLSYFSGVNSYNEEEEDTFLDTDSDYSASSSNSLTAQHISINDWDSSLYGKPVCTKIPTNMSLCAKINYEQMRVPNLIGHESVEEIVYQSSVWLPLIQIKCHPDTQLFLCSLFAPICLEQAIYPCRSLCENVRRGCEARMNAYNYPWPAMFDCNKFPDDNGLCIQPEAASKVSVTEQTSTKPTTTTTTTTSLSTTTTTITTTTTQKLMTITPHKSKKKNQKKFDDQCKGCGELVTTEHVLEMFCQSDIVLRGRIQTFQNANLAPAKKTLKDNQFLSQFITISKRNRRIFKGQRIVSNTNSYLTGNAQQTKDRRRIDVFLLSKNHLSTINGTVKKPRNKIIYLKSVQNATSKYCHCKNLKRNAHKKGAKYLIMANIVKTENIVHRKRNVRNQNSTNGKQQLLYMTYILPWNRARQLAKFLDDDYDRDEICNSLNA